MQILTGKRWFLSTAVLIRAINYRYWRGKSAGSMKNILYPLLVIFFFICSPVLAQVDFTANDIVPEYSSGFRFGTNMGGQMGKWDDFKLATLAAGSEESGVAGAGCNSLRLSLPHQFLETWGYEIREKTFLDYRDKLGMSEQTVFLGTPATSDRDTKVYCSGKENSKLFKNLYEPIWDNGKNGTPVNDKNIFALYVYKTAKTYGETVRFWEIFNEPDYTSSDKGWQPATANDSWWKRDPAPCELNNMLAPVQHYIRSLRIAYEVIKYVDPDAFIAVGGIGYESFLDAILRNSDNPDGGKITAQYPLKGGAYFDALSYHSYPMYETREYTNGKWVPMRHSDKAVEVFINSKNRKEQVLFDHGYDGSKYPRKRVIVTETNVPRKAFGDYIGSEKAQYNYLSKIIIKGQQEGIDQIHTYKLVDSKNASGPFDVTGFYSHLENVNPFQQKENLSAVATRNTMQLLDGYRYSNSRTKALKLPENVDGAAFSKDGEFIYALWAKTKQDNKEESSASYTFPAAWMVEGFKKYDWNYTVTKKSADGTGGKVQLNASPAFFVLESDYVLGVNDAEDQGLVIFPNPATDQLTISMKQGAKSLQQGAIYNVQGQRVQTFKIDQATENQILDLNLASGLYFIRMEGKSQQFVRRLIVN